MGDTASIRCTAIVMFQLHSKALRSEDFGVCLKRVGAVDSCVMLGAGHVLTGHKEREEGKK